MGRPGLGAGTEGVGTRRERRVDSRVGWVGLISSCVGQRRKSESFRYQRQRSRAKGKEGRGRRYGQTRGTRELSRLWRGSGGHESRLGPTLASTAMTDREGDERRHQLRSHRGEGDEHSTDLVEHKRV
jgi:hypothetical protein